MVVVSYSDLRSEREVDFQPPTTTTPSTAGPRGGINETSQTRDLFYSATKQAQFFYSSCCMAHVIYSGPFRVMKFIQQKAMEYFSVNSGLPSTLL